MCFGILEMIFSASSSVIIGMIFGCAVFGRAAWAFGVGGVHGVALLSDMGGE